MKYTLSLALRVWSLFLIMGSLYIYIKQIMKYILSLALNVYVDMV